MRADLLQVGALAVALLTPPAALGQEAPSDFEGPSQTLDLAEVPLGPTLLQQAGLFLRDAILERQLNKELAEFTSTLSDAIKNKDVGYLLEVGLYVDEFGVPMVPGGQLLRPIGVGTEPIDALAEDLRKPRLTVTRPGGLRNASYYVWLTKRGSLQASLIPREFRDSLLASARAEAKRRDLLTSWKRRLPSEAFATIQRAEFWQEAATRHSARLASDNHRALVADLTRQMSRLQGEVNKIYADYQQLEREVAENLQQQAALARIQTVLGIVHSAIEVHSLVSSENQRPATAAGTPEVPITERLEWTKREIHILNGRLVETTSRLRIEGGKLMELDQKLRGTFEADGIPLPKAEPDLRLP